jgi:hypothetical protein
VLLVPHGEAEVPVAGMSAHKFKIGQFVTYNPRRPSGLGVPRSDRGLGPDIAGGTRTVLNDEWLLETFGEPSSHQAGDDVGGAASGKSREDTHWPRRIGLRPCEMGRKRQRPRPSARIDGVESLPIPINGRFRKKPPPCPTLYSASGPM